MRLDDSTIRRHKVSFIEGGLGDYIKNPFTGGTCKLEMAQLQELEDYLDRHLCETTDDVIKYVEENFEIT